MAVRWLTEKPSQLIDRKHKELRQVVIPVIARRTAKQLEDNIKHFTPIGVRWTILPSGTAVSRPSGELQRSIKRDVKGRWRKVAGISTYVVAVTTNKYYAEWVEHGTSPHIIKPKYAKGELEFVVNGKVVTSKTVKHPGTRGVGMFRKGTSQTRSQIQMIAKPVLNVWASDSKIRRAKLTLELSD